MSAEDQIRQFAERIVRLEEERKALAADIKEIKSEAKSAGYSPKLIAACVRIMLMEAEKRAEALAGHEELDLYLGAVGLIARHEDDETRRDAGGRGRPDLAASVRTDSPANAEATKVVVRAAQCASAPYSRLSASESESEPHCPQPQRKQLTGGDSSERRHTLSRFGASDLDQSVRGNALCGTPSRAGGEIARHTHSGRS